MGDFSILPLDGGAMKKLKTEVSEQRTYLRVYETLPTQMLSAYGAAAYTGLEEKEIWGHLVKPQKTGAAFLTEYASKGDERRGVAINRRLLPVLHFCRHQNIGREKCVKYAVSRKHMADLAPKVR